MENEPDIIKELREAEKLGLFQSKVQSAYKELETPKEASDDVPDETVSFAEDAAEGKARDDDTNYEKTKGASWLLEETWRSLTENTDDTVMVVDNNNVIQFVNKTIPPTTPESVVGKTVYEYVSKEHHDTMRKSLKKVYETGQPDTYEVSLNMTNINPKLGILWFRTKVIPIKSDKVVSGVIMIATDITRQKQVEKDLQERIKELKCLYGVASITERPGIALNELYLEVANLLPLSWQYPENACTRIIIDNMKFETENFRETEWKQSADIKVYGAIAGVVEVFYLEERPELDEGPFSKEERLLIEAIVERLGRITERMQAEEKLKESEERYHDLFENANDIIQAVKPDGSFLYVNHAWRKALGYNEKEIENLSVFDIIHPNSKEHCMKIFKRIMSGKNIEHVEASFKTKDGKEIIVEGSINCWFKEGKPVSTRGIFRDVTERKKMEKSMDLLSTAVKTSIDAITVTSPIDGKLIFCNDIFLKLWKVKGDYHNITYTDCFDIGPDVLKKTAQTTMTGGWAGELTAKTMNGQTFPVLVTSSPVTDKDSRVIGLLSIFKDITEQKKAEEKIKQQNTFLQNIIEAISNPFYVIDADDYSILMANTASNLDDLSGETRYCYKITHKREKHCDGTKHPCPLKIIKKTKKPVKVEHIHYDKNDTARLFEVYGYPILDENGNVVQMIEYSLDITERRKAENAVQESTKRYHELIEGSHDGYIVTDMDGKIIECNSIFKKITGYTDEEVHQKTYKDITPKEWHSKEEEIIKEQVLNRGYSNVYEKELIGKDGRIISVELRTYLLKQKDKPQGMWSFVRDITDRKQIEDELMSKINDLERYKNITVGRELRIIELKEKVKKLEQKLEKKSE